MRVKRADGGLMVSPSSDVHLSGRECCNRQEGGEGERSDGQSPFNSVSSEQRRRPELGVSERSLTRSTPRSHVHV
jgi:hypothetical protein